ncbi:hypothetical protein LKL35_36040 [Streptomyces sp. ET3-23]|uniref:hypothetical protein n=1 Tax=Streptomyces sp. ET3-23 TaxID=2885643 RepID=UPI001D12724F|nr:hypothetical protein [Streptomyces sp. ET3-23]MCC2280749.1 hypothetical protein [Streptomyces sp. ET3-23]
MQQKAVRREELFRELRQAVISRQVGAVRAMLARVNTATRGGLSAQEEAIVRTAESFLKRIARSVQEKQLNGVEPDRGPKRRLADRQATARLQVGDLLDDLRRYGKGMRLDQLRMRVRLLSDAATVAGSTLAHQQRRENAHWRDQAERLKGRQDAASVRPSRQDSGKERSRTRGPAPADGKKHRPEDAGRLPPRGSG